MYFWIYGNLLVKLDYAYYNNLYVFSNVLYVYNYYVEMTN